ncbi:MAG TPA: hypothetical protein VF761_05420 [Gemmatimonadaceae bacterium]
MPVTYEFVGDVLVISASGVYPADDVTRAFGRALADPARPVIRALLYDVRDSEVVGTRSTPEVRAAVAFFRDLGPRVGNRVALLATADVGYGVMRMVAGWADAAGIEAAVFRNHGDAIAWASR